MASYTFESTGTGVLVSGRNMTDAVFVHATGQVKALAINNTIFFPVINDGNTYTVIVRIREGLDANSTLIQQQNVEVDFSIPKPCTVLDNIPLNGGALINISSSDYSASAGYDGFVNIFTDAACTAPVLSRTAGIVEKSCSILIDGLSNEVVYHAKVGLSVGQDAIYESTTPIQIRPTATAAKLTIDNVVKTADKFYVKVNRSAIGTITGNFSYVVDVFDLNGATGISKTLIGDSVSTAIYIPISDASLQAGVNYTFKAHLKFSSGVSNVFESSPSGPHQFDASNVLPYVSSLTSSISGNQLTLTAAYTPDTTTGAITYFGLMNQASQYNGAVIGGQYTNASSVTYTFGTNEIPYDTYAPVAGYSIDGSSVVQSPAKIGTPVTLSDPNSVAKNVTAVSRDISGSTVTATVSYSNSIVSGDKALVALSRTADFNGIISSSAQQITNPASTASFTIDGTTYSYDTDYYVASVYTTGQGPAGTVVFSPSFRIANPSNAPSLTKLDTPAISNISSVPTEANTLYVTYLTVTSASSYKIEYGVGSSPTSWSEANITPAGANQVKISGLVGGTTYSIRATAIGNYTTHSDSDPTIAPFLAGTPLRTLSAPNVTAQLGVRSINLAWPAVTNATSYEVKYKLASASTWVTASAPTPANGGFSSDLTGLTPGAAYDIEVSALASGYIIAKITLSRTVNKVTLETPSVTLTANGDATSLSAEWEPISNAATYDIDFTSNNGGSWTSLATDLQITSHVFTMDSALPSWKVRVKAHPSANSTEYLASAYGESNRIMNSSQPAQKLADPTNVSVAVTTRTVSGESVTVQSSLTASWSHTGGAGVTYLLETGDGQGLWDYVSSTPLTSFTFFTGFDTPVYVRVTAIAASNSGYTDSDPVESTSGATPVQPSGGPSNNSILKALFDSSFEIRAGEFKVVLTQRAQDVGSISMEVAGGAGGLTVAQWLAMMDKSSLSSASYKKVVAYDVGNVGSIDVDLDGIGVSSSDVTITYLNSNGDYIFKDAGAIVGKVVVNSSQTPKYAVYSYSSGNYSPASPDANGYYAMGTKRFRYLADGSVLGDISVNPSGGNTQVNPNPNPTPSVLPAPTGLQLVPTPNTAGSLTASWSAVTGYGMVLYDLEYSTNGSTWQQFPYVNNTTYTAATTLIISSSVPVSVRVRTMPGPGSSNTASSFSASVGPATPTAPSGGSVTPPGGGSVTPPAGNAVCFLADAPVLTPAGYRTISSISVGDLVRTAAGRDVAVKRVFRKQYEASAAVNPYVIPKGSFGAVRALPISPNHEVMTSKGMVAAKDLGLKKMKMTGTFTYYNLELEDWVRDNLVVAGVECESLAPAKRVTMTKAEFARFVMARYQPSALTRLRTVCFEEADGKVSMPAFR